MCFVRDIFGPFSQLRKVAVSLVVSDRIEQYGFHWTDFHGLDWKFFEIQVQKSSPLMKIHRRHCDIIVAGVISNAMQCNAYSIMNTVWYIVQFLKVRTEGVWQKILQELGHCGCLWILILGGSTKLWWGRLGQTYVNFSVSHSMWALCSLWNTMKSCVSLCHHLKQEQYYLLTYLLTYSMEQSPSWEANWFCS